jgi:hypothetical protein
VSSVPLPVEAGFGCLVLVASNVFVITNQTFTYTNKNTAPLWMGNLRYQGAWFLPALRLCRLLTLLLLLWQFLWRRSTLASLPSADVLAIVGAAEFAEFQRLVSSPVPAGNPKSKI